MFPAILGLLGGSSAVTGAMSSVLSGGAKAVKNFVQGGGLVGAMSRLFGGADAQGGKPGTDAMALLNDIKNMLGQLTNSMNSQQSGGSHGGGSSHHAGQSHGTHGKDGAHGGGCNGDWRTRDKDGGDSCGGSSQKEPENSCGSDDVGGADWDGKDKSPSLDREQAAKRLLEQAKNTDDPEQKRELIKMALEMLGKGGGCGDGNSYDKDIVKQAEKMMDSIDSSNLNDCNASKAMDSVIDMLTKEGGVDGKPADNDHNGDGWADRRFHAQDSHGGGLWHVHDHHTMHR